MAASRPGHPIQIRFWIGLLCFFVLSVTFCLLVWATAPALLGWRPVAVTSGSMQPLIMPGDIVVAQPHGGHGLAAGSVIVIEEPGGDGLVTHRIVGETPGGEYTTRGDANSISDSTPVPPDRVAGVGRLLVPIVGAPLVWAWEGRWAPVVLVALAVLAAGWCSRWALLDQFDPWRGRTWRGPHVHHPRRVALPAGLHIVIPLLGLALVFGSTPPASSALTAATANAGNTLAASNAFSLWLYLHNEPSPPIGNTTSHSDLSMDATVPAGTVLYNYDTNRDSDPGLKIAKGSGVSETDQTKHQFWSAPGPLDLDGSATLTFWAAMKQFETSKAGTVMGALLDCPDLQSSCITVATGSVSDNPWDPGATGTWVEKTIDLGTVNYSVAAGRILRIKIVVGGASGDDMWFAYDTTSYPTHLRVGP